MVFYLVAANTTAGERARLELAERMDKARVAWNGKCVFVSMLYACTPYIACTGSELKLLMDASTEMGKRALIDEGHNWLHPGDALHGPL